MADVSARSQPAKTMALGGCHYMKRFAQVES